jgi:hypothetical protein
MVRYKILICLCFTLIIITGCYYDKEALLYPPGTCNSAGSTYSATVSPILTLRCNSCHSKAAASTYGGGIELDRYTTVKPYASNGALLGSINHASGYSPMPKDGAKLSSCEIDKITNWVNSGAPDN